jgi:hypothetical protein
VAVHLDQHARGRAGSRQAAIMALAKAVAPARSPDPLDCPPNTNEAPAPPGSPADAGRAVDVHARYRRKRMRPASCMAVMHNCEQDECSAARPRGRAWEEPHA